MLNILNINNTPPNIIRNNEGYKFIAYGYLQGLNKNSIVSSATEYLRLQNPKEKS